MIGSPFKGDTNYHSAPYGNSTTWVPHIKLEPNEFRKDEINEVCATKYVVRATINEESENYLEVRERRVSIKFIYCKFRFPKIYERAKLQKLIVETHKFKLQKKDSIRFHLK